MFLIPVYIIYDSTIASALPYHYWSSGYATDLEYPCCSNSTTPWFIKTLPQSVNDDIELRMCSSEGYVAEATPIDIIEIYIC